MTPMKTLGQRVQLAFAGLFFRGLDWKRRLKEGAMPKSAPAAAGKLYQFSVKTIDGREKSLADYKGRVLLIVNTASLCGFTPQYDSLEQLQRKYKDRGFSVLAFPANEFGAQEPGSDSEIAGFCKSRYDATFDLFSKIVVKGADIHPLYRFLTTESGHNGEIAWNFTKFLVGQDGSVSARYDPPTDPLSRKVTARIEELLG